MPNAKLPAAFDDETPQNTTSESGTGDYVLPPQRDFKVAPFSSRPTADSRAQ